MKHFSWIPILTLVSIQAFASDMQFQWDQAFKELGTNSQIGADLYSMADLNVAAESAYANLESCSLETGKTVSEIYQEGARECSGNVKTDIKNLKINIRAFLKTSSVSAPEDFHRIERNLMHPLTTQILLEEFSDRKVLWKGIGPKNIGLCKGFISIGVCNDRAPEAPTLNEEEIKILRLLTYFPLDACHVGLWPAKSYAYLAQALRIQGSTSLGPNVFASGRAAEILHAGSSRSTSDMDTTLVNFRQLQLDAEAKGDFKTAEQIGKVIARLQPHGSSASRPQEPRERMRMLLKQVNGSCVRGINLSEKIDPFFRQLKSVH